MQFVATLIDAAVKVCGSQAEVARRLGVKPQDVSQWKSGKRPLSPEDAALLADLGHMDARQAVVDAVIVRNMGTRKGRVLLEVLGKALAASVGGLLVFSYGMRSADATAMTSRNAPPSHIGSTFQPSYSLRRSVRRWLAKLRGRPFIRATMTAAQA